MTNKTTKPERRSGKDRRVYQSGVAPQRRFSERRAESRVPTPRTDELYLNVQQHPYAEVAFAKMHDHALELERGLALSKDETAAAVRRFARLLIAVDANDFYIDCLDVDGVNWFDCRDELRAAFPDVFKEKK